MGGIDDLIGSSQLLLFQVSGNDGSIPLGTNIDKGDLSYNF